MEQGKVLALGFFDGVHRGHQAILHTAAQLAWEKGMEPAAVTFERHPRAFVLGRAPDLISTFARRVALLQENGAKLVIALPFDRRMAETTPEDFGRMLIERYQCAVVVCGENFRFGKNAAGTPQSLAALGLETHVVPPVTQNGKIVSSTHIRNSVREGDPVLAAQMLGRPFSLEGPIVGGFQRGRTLGYPTVNLCPEDGILLPRRGVYATSVTVAEGTFPAVTNVGTRPTFSDADIVSVESYLLNFSGDLYGETAQVAFLRYLRPERSFSDGQALREQISRDIRQALALDGSGETPANP